MKPTNTPVILASGSVWRAQLLRRLLADFACLSPDIDETAQTGEAPADLACRLARQKAAAIATRQPQAIVIGSDQVAAVAGQILGKPGTKAAARRQLALQSGQEVVFQTGLCVHAPAFAQPRLHLEQVTTRFRHLSADEIARYVDNEDVAATAGSLKAEGLGITLVEAIQSSDPTALLGLPLIALRRLLVQAGMHDLP